MQKIESVIDEVHAALAVGRRLGLREARQSGVVDAAEFAVEIGGLDVQARQRREGARIFVGPVEPGPVSNCTPPGTVQATTLVLEIWFQTAKPRSREARRVSAAI